MAWSNPSTKAVGSVLTAAEWNIQVANTDFLGQPPSVSIGKSTEQAIATGTWTALQWSAQRWDNDSMWSSTASNRIDINTAGKYLATLNVTWNGSTLFNHYRIIGIGVGQTTNAYPNQGEERRLSVVAGEQVSQSISRIINLTSTQYLRAMVYQDDGISRNVGHSTASSYPSLEVLWVSS